MWSRKRMPVRDVAPARGRPDSGAAEYPSPWWCDGCWRFSFPVLLQLTWRCAEWRARRAGAIARAARDALRCRAAKHAQERHARALATPAHRPNYRPDKAPTRGSACRPAGNASPSGSRLEPLHVVHGHRAARKGCATPKWSSVCRSSRRVRPVKSASSARLAQRSSSRRRHQPALPPHVAARAIHRPSRFSGIARFTSAYSTFVAQRIHPIRGQPPIVVVPGAALPLLDVGISRRGGP